MMPFGGVICDIPALAQEIDVHYLSKYTPTLPYTLYPIMIFSFLLGRRYWWDGGKPQLHKSKRG